MRRVFITKKHPEVQDLPTYDVRQGFYSLSVVIAQILLCYAVHVYNPSWKVVTVGAIFVSSTLNHVCFSSVHELSHFLFWPGRFLNLLNLIVVNIPMAVPAGIGFWRYHTDHHVYLGVHGNDPDLPTEFEARFFRGRLRKAIFVTLFPFVYTLRPLLVRPKPVIMWDVANWATIITTDVSIAYFWGAKSFFYLLFGTYISFSFHPFIGHILAEHYLFPERTPQDTYSYYGWLNMFLFNVGYHIEHHDFPSVPGSYLPKLKETASKYYQSPSVSSWGRCIYQFVFDDKVSLFSRLERETNKGGPVIPPHVKCHEGDIPPDPKYWRIQDL